MKSEFPKLRFQFKADHWYWKAIHWLVLIITFGGNRKFLTGFTTTIGNTIAWGAGHTNRIKNRPHGWESRVWSCLMHEREHLRQFKKYTLPGMAILYCLIYFPVGLAWFRAKFERDGYIQTLRCWYKLNPKWAKSEEAMTWIVNQFTGPNYFYSWPFKETVKGWFSQELSRLQQ